ncbi:MAG: DUF1501 domain-containing protein [Planctomycetaceae bacterium]|nr:DUF1501 domain-containing protein [Planctomycetales bacterium]MCB9873692.1 DUF1501 domain-containing protein [Planctomycetaceae bacterium]MCB9938173.1 DUF1501 domain-containing protein [Planctomycetaceae bacterium]HRX77963.1 DUF1501 domain-containing protein [Pirellulaceae bacterium]
MTHLSTRRDFLRASGATVALATGSSLFTNRLFADDTVANAAPTATADSCIFLWLGGGACHIDTWDPKKKGDAKAKKAGSYYDAIPTAIEGVNVCEHLPRMAKLLDRTILMRTCHHDVIDEHAAAVNRVHVGRPPTGTTVYPSIGSVASHELGARGEGVPAYVVMGYPSASRGPGFLGAKHSYLYLTETELGPTGLKRPADVTDLRQQRREAMLAELRRAYLERNPGQRRLEDYAASSIEGLKLAGPKFMSVFDLKSEADSVRGAYGGEFGQRCLLARRLVQEGVRFVEVSFNLNFINGTGWDTHNEGQLNQHIMIEQLDQAFAALIEDLERRQRLDKTLIVVATEFGRPPEFDGGGGRGHYSKAFSMVLAGGGLKTGQAVGTTDELGNVILDNPVSIADFHATIYRAMGIDHAKELYDGVRPVPITDRGLPVAQCFA